jgi:hypothetical protein
VPKATVSVVVACIAVAVCEPLSLTHGSHVLAMAMKPAAVLLAEMSSCRIPSVIMLLQLPTR